MTLKEIGLIVAVLVCIILFLIVREIQISMLFKRFGDLQMNEDDFDDEDILE